MSLTPDVSSLVPTFDISNPSATELAAVDAACRDHGFFLLVGHGADRLIADMWRVTAAFFAENETVKGPVRRTEDNPFGYWDRELTKRKRDHKEVFDYADPFGPTADLNRWPEGRVEFAEILVEFYDTFARLASDTLGVIRDALGLGREHTAEELGFLDARTSSAVRLNHYPVGDPVPADQRDGLAELGPTALGYHTDPGVLTLLLQDDTGGLQAESTTHGWIDVPPMAGAIVVNLGDAMQVWTNDQYKAAVHRVVPMTEQSRYSIPYFSNPPRDATLEPLAAVMAAEGVTARYRSFGWKEYMAGRMADNFADYGVEDIQISDFLIDA
ncbi:MAG: 2OG-Fe(II) oxygenase family protein [Actinomycetota bacterium]